MLFVLDCQSGGNEPAFGVADQRDPGEAQLLQQGLRMVGSLLPIHVSAIGRNAAPPETRLIIGNDPMVPRQREEGAKPGQPSVYAQAGAMQKQQRRALTGLEYECADAD